MVDISTLEVGGRVNVTTETKTRKGIVQDIQHGVITKILPNKGVVLVKLENGETARIDDMETLSKRRGRPAGSTNKPKAETAEKPAAKAGKKVKTAETAGNTVEILRVILALIETLGEVIRTEIGEEPAAETAENGDDDGENGDDDGENGDEGEEGEEDDIPAPAPVRRQTAAKPAAKAPVALPPRRRLFA